MVQRVASLTTTPLFTEGSVRRNLRAIILDSLWDDPHSSPGTARRVLLRHWPECLSFWRARKRLRGKCGGLDRDPVIRMSLAGRSPQIARAPMRRSWIKSPTPNPNSKTKRRRTFRRSSRKRALTAVQPGEKHGGPPCRVHLRRQTRPSLASQAGSDGRVLGHSTLKLAKVFGPPLLAVRATITFEPAGACRPMAESLFPASATSGVLVFASPVVTVTVPE